jgi:NADH:ubiquinone oxidoreductase subunit 2 (subunit N)
VFFDLKRSTLVILMLAAINIKVYAIPYEQWMPHMYMLSEGEFIADMYICR